MILPNSRDDANAVPVTPPFERVAQAFAIAPITAALPFAIVMALFALLHGMTLGRTLQAVGMGAAILGVWAYPVALVFGIPSYVLFHERLPPAPLSSPIVGALIGGLVAMGLQAVAAPELLNGLYLRGLIGWPHLLVLGLACGALPGWVFFAIVTRPVRSTSG